MGSVHETESGFHGWTGSLSLLAIAFILLSGCSDAMSDNVEGGLSAEATATVEAPPDSGAALALEGEGLRVFMVPSGRARPIPFGTSMDTTLDVLTRVQQAPREQGQSIECQASYASWDDGFTVWFVRDRFVGWSVRSGEGTLTTARGIGPGSTRGDLEAAHAVQIIPSSLGIEFTTGGMAGLLDSSRPDARVVILWAGQTCIAR